MSNSDLKRPYHYFNENQLGIRVGHGAGTPDIESVWQWIGQQKESVSGKSLKISTPPDTDKRQYTFPTRQDIATATKTFVFRDVSGLDTKELARLVNQINTSPKPNFGSTVLEYVALNWLGCGGQLVGDGGPGGPPMPSGGPPDPPNYGFTFSTLGSDLPPVEDRGQGVKVAILDTAPSEGDLKSAFGTWGNKTGNDQHALVDNLLGPNGRLKHVEYYASTIAKSRLDAYRLDSHPYSIVDHGLFIAGIVNAIAPEAEIYLFEALSPHGACDSESVLAGLAWVRDQFKGEKRLVVNCSLFLVIPLKDKQFDKDILTWFDKPSDWLGAVQFTDWLRAQGGFTAAAFQSFSNDGAAVTAAAGNDGAGGNRPGTRFPAAFDDVLGVGALKHKRGSTHEPADYSNIDDEPAQYGVITLGGEKPPQRGVQGVYISPQFPPSPTLPYGQVNDYGWGRWAGTSFATPVISGVLAAMMGDHQKFGDAQAAINTLRGHTTNLPPFNEEALDVTQP